MHKLREAGDGTTPVLVIRVDWITEEWKFLISIKGENSADRYLNKIKCIRNIIMYSSSMMAIAYYCHIYGGCELQFGSN
jgi:hypothetical protein